jgi:hypothetical protein
MREISAWKKALTITALLLALGAPALAQLQTGNLYGTIHNLDGTPLPGVTVTLTGGGAPQVQATDAQGKFRFPGLAPGAYSVEAQLQEFGTVRQNDLVINVGHNTDVQLEMRQVAEDFVDVVGERAPMLDQHKFSPGETVSAVELRSIPTPRDPWSVIQTTPGVLTDRINVGGSESGQQSQYVGPGSGGDQAVWSLDGVVITDMSALGSSPGYFDFDAFEELQVTTGGSDASIATGGVVLNMVTRRGTNELRGSGRYYSADKGNQSSLRFDQSELGKAGAWNNGHAQTAFAQGNRIDKITDWGVEMGGPVVRDRLWVWGSYAKPEIDLRTLNNFSDKTTLEAENGKLNGQITPANSATAFVWNSKKTKLGRNAGPTRPQETTWDQSNFGSSPTTWKVEDTQIAGSSFYVTGLYSVVNGGFQLIPEGGDKMPYFDADRVWHNSFFLAQSARPQKQARLDASNFFQTGNLSHELKYGAGYRIAEQSSLSRTPGGGWESDGTLLLARDGRIDLKAKYQQLYAQDTVAVGNLTANLGLRYDRQGGTINDINVQANPVFPDLLPAAHFAGRDAGFNWATLAPRLGLTWALGAQRNTLLRASYSRFADQLGTAQVSWLNPLGAQQYRYFDTSNHGGPTLEPSDLGPEAGAPSGNTNPLTYAALESNAIDRNLKAPVTDELLLGVEHALLPELVVGLHGTWRKHTGNLEPELLVFDGNAYAPENLASTGRVHRRDDYVLAEPIHGVLPNGRPYTINYYELRDGVTTRNGFLLKNGDREQDFRGVSLTLDKRLADRWMMHGNVSWQDWTWSIPDRENQDPTDNIAGGIVNGSQVLQGSGTSSGAKGNVFINSKWSYSLNGMYQVAPSRPWGFNLAANLQGRQGYPIRYGQRIFRNTIADTPGLGIVVPVTSDADSFRYPNVHTLDFRVEKDFRLSELGLTVSADVFNALNESTVLQRQGVLGGNKGDYVQEILSPRVFRLGARVSFR